jgi:hypothetical protein
VLDALQPQAKSLSAGSVAIPFHLAEPLGEQDVKVRKQAGLLSRIRWCLETLVHGVYLLAGRGAPSMSGRQRPNKTTTSTPDGARICAMASALL